MSVGKSATTQERAIDWRDVVSILPTDEERELAARPILTAGFSRDDVRSSHKCREILLEALIRIEDARELARDTEARREARSTLRTLRRRLETELWP